MQVLHTCLSPRRRPHADDSIEHRAIEGEGIVVSSRDELDTSE